MSYSSELLASSISKLYPDGMQSLMSTKGPQLNDTYIILVFNCPPQFYLKYCSEEDKEQKKLKGLNLFSGLVELDYVHLATGLNEETPLDDEFNETKQTEDIKKKLETTVKFKSL